MDDFHFSSQYCGNKHCHLEFLDVMALTFLRVGLYVVLKNRLEHFHLISLLISWTIESFSDKNGNDNADIASMRIGNK